VLWIELDPAKISSFYCPSCSFLPTPSIERSVWGLLWSCQRRSQSLHWKEHTMGQTCNFPLKRARRNLEKSSRLPPLAHNLLPSCPSLLSIAISQPKLSGRPQHRIISFAKKRKVPPTALQVMHLSKRHAYVITRPKVHADSAAIERL